MNNANKLKHSKANHSRTGDKRLASLLRPVRADLVNSCGAADLCLVEGDSVVAEALGDSSLDWTSGGQFLHLTFLVEKYLLDMRERGVSYRVVFIDSNRALWEQGSSQLLGRELIYRHLKFNSDFDVDCIPSWLNSSALQAKMDSRPEAGLWDEYLTKHNPSFVLLTDGGKLPQDSALIAQGLIVDCLQRDINVVFSQLDFQSRRVYGFLVRPSPALSQFRSRVVVARTLAARETRAQGGFDKDSLASLLTRFGLRQTIFFLAFTSALEDNRASAYPEDWESLGKIYLLHLVLLAHLPLKARAQRLGEADDHSALQQVVAFLSSVHGHSIAWLQECDTHLESVAANGTAEAKSILAELADFADGRLFFKVLDLVTNNAKQPIDVGGLTTVLGFTPAMVEETLDAWNQICLIQGQEAGPFFPLSSGHNLTRSAPAKDHLIDVHQLQMVSCSLTRAVLGDELADKLNVSEVQEGESTLVAPKNSHPYVENYHWHSGRSLEVDHRHHGEYDIRATQKYLKFVHTYAESLEGTIVHHTGGSIGSAVESATIPTDIKAHKAPKQTNNKKGVSRKKQLCDINAAKRIKEAEEAARTKLDTVCTRASGAQALNDIDTFILTCPVKHVALEALLRKLAIYLRQHRTAEQERGDDIVVEDLEKNTKAAIFGLAQHVCEHYAALLDSSVLTLLADSLTWAGFPDAAQSLREEFSGALVQDTPAAKAAKPKPKVAAPKVAAPKTTPMAANIHKVRRMLNDLPPLKSTPAVDFQLDNMGHLLSRKSLGSRSDPRVTFTPDEWQIKLLDVVDRKGSALVCAPTSSGKTFISYYCMEKVLSESEDGVVVYVSPTKALVNQVAAEVYARFRTKSCGTQSVFGMFTRDYRYKPLNCRILVTVPACLEIFLLSPQNRNWVSRLRYVIFDEVHSIANPSDGPTWERLLLLINCPFLALSATVGNPSTFHQWLVAVKSHQQQQCPPGQQRPIKPKRGAKSDQASQQDFGVALISHHERYSDLAKRVFAIPPGPHGEEPQAKPFIKDLHPYVALNLTRLQKCGFPKDLTLEPRQCLQLYNAMLGSVPEHPLDGLLAAKLQQASPATYFKHPHAISRQEVREYEQTLQEIFVQLSEPSAQAVLNLLDPDTRAMSNSQRGETAVDRHIFPLLMTLKQQNRLPAIFFTLDRDRCEDFATTVMRTLHRLTKVAIAEVQGSEKDVKHNEKMVERHRKAARSKRDADTKDTKDASGNQPETRDPSDLLRQKIRDVIMRHSFGEPGKQLPEHVHQRLMFKIKKGLDPGHILVKALQYGIGVHHAGLPTSYRQAVEWLFRVGALRVVFATGTLALGIHMPCKTVVFAEDSIYLDSLAFRQMSGRAGRRGHDLLGHVLFFGLPYSKVQRLLTADLTRIRGEFPVNASLVLRCMILHHQLNGSEPECVHSLTRLFHRPLFCMDHDPTNLLVRLHFRYSVEYLIETGLLSPQGAPLDYSGLVAHLSWTEPANFLFLTLLTKGVFKRICDPIANCKAGSPAEMEVLKEMMLVLCHLFERRTLHPSVLGIDFAELGPSKVILEDLPRPIAQVLEEHNTRALRLFSSCARAFAAKLAPEVSLPASKLTIPLGAINHSQPTTTAAGQLDAGSIRYHVRSPFIATSGHGDRFTSVDELEREVRTQAYIHRSAIPTLSQRGIRNTKLLLNRYALDFLTHGQYKAMAKANGLVGGEAWDCLYSFSLILKTISTALRKLSCSEEEFKRLLQDEAEWAADPLRRVSDDHTVQAFFRLSTVFAQLLQQHQRR